MVEAQEEEAKEEHVLETNEASDDELEAEHWGNHSPDDQRKTAPSRRDQARQFARLRLW